MGKKLAKWTFLSVTCVIVFTVLNVIRFFPSNGPLVYRTEGTDDFGTYVVLGISMALAYGIYRAAAPVGVFIGRHWRAFLKLTLACAVSFGAYTALMFVAVVKIPFVICGVVGGWHPIPPTISVSVCGVVSIGVGYATYQGLTKLFLQHWPSKPHMV